MDQCNRCNLQYMGETKRRLKDRFNEHRRAVMYGQVAPSFVDRIVQSTKLTLNLNPLLFLNTFSLTLTILVLTCS